MTSDTTSKYAFIDCSLDELLCCAKGMEIETPLWLFPEIASELTESNVRIAVGRDSLQSRGLLAESETGPVLDEFLATAVECVCVPSKVAAIVIGTIQSIQAGWIAADGRVVVAVERLTEFVLRFRVLPHDAFAAAIAKVTALKIDGSALANSIVFDGATLESLTTSHGAIVDSISSLFGEDFRVVSLTLASKRPVGAASDRREISWLVSSSGAYGLVTQSDNAVGIEPISGLALLSKLDASS